MRFLILLVTIAYINVLCSACSGSKSCLTNALAEMSISYAAIGQSEQALQVAQSMNKSTIKVELLSQIAFLSAKAGQAKQAATMFSQAIKEAKKLESPLDRVMGLDAIATRYRKLGQNDKAAAILSQSVQEMDEIWGISLVKDTVLEKIAVSYAKLGDYNRGIQLANKIVEDIAQGRALAQIVAQYVAQGDYEQAREVAKTIKSQVSQANALTEIAAKTGEYQQALLVAQKIDQDENAKLKVIILTKIALLYSENKQKKQANEVFFQAGQVAKIIENPVDQVNQFTKIAQLYLNVGNIQQTVKFLTQSLQVTRNIQSQSQRAVFLAKIAVIYGQAGQNNLASSVFTESLQIAQTLEKEEKTNTLVEIAIASAKIKSYHQTIEMLSTLGDTNHQAFALTQIAKNYAKAKPQEDAIQALNQAFKLVHSSKNSNPKNQNLAEIAFQLSKNFQYDQAIAVAQTIDVKQNNSPKAFTLARIANSYAKAGQKEKAIALLSQAIEVAQITKCSD